MENLSTENYALSSQQQQQNTVLIAIETIPVIRFGQLLELIYLNKLIITYFFQLPWIKMIITTRERQKKAQQFISRAKKKNKINLN